MEIYVHSTDSEDPALVTTTPGERIRDLVASRGNPQTDSLWIADSDQPLAPETTLDAAGIGQRSHVHLGPCKRVEVKVRYNGDRQRAFGPSATVDRVFKWAVGQDGFDLTPAEAAKHTLAVCGADHALDRSALIGSLATGDCDACLDLAPKSRFEG